MNHFTRVLLLSLLSLSLSALASEQDLKQLRKGVAVINAGGIPGPVSAFSPESFAIVTGTIGKAQLPVAAATRFGKGRAVALGKGEFLIPKALKDVDNLQFLRNLIAWASPAKEPKIGVISSPGFANALKAEGFDARDISLPEMKDVDVIIARLTRGTPPNAGKYRDQVHAGKGLIAGCLGWGWKQLNPGKSLSRDHLGNQLFAPMGIVWLDGMLKRNAPDNAGFKVGSLPKFSNAGEALDAALADYANEKKLDKNDRLQVSALLSRTAAVLPADEKYLQPRLQELLADQKLNVVPSPKNPVRETSLLPRLVLTMQLRDIENVPVELVKAHPAAASFPGVVPANAPRISAETTVDPQIPKWCSTGLYAAPGEKINITFPKAFINKGYKIRIGSTTCNLWSKSHWSRAPQVIREFTVKKENFPVANAFGGLLYVVVPAKATGQPFRVRFENAVSAPIFKLGETTAGDWLKIREFPAPRAELTSKKTIITVPSEFVRTLDDPEKLMQVWDQIVDVTGDLVNHEPGWRGFPQRYTADCQLCAGYMHAGHPIMIPISTADEATNAEQLLTKGNWGFFHEIGHNHQNRDWTFGGTGEVTVNLFSMYTYEKVCGVKPEDGRLGKKLKRSEYEYLNKEPDFARWKRDPFLALRMYWQLQQSFGWEAYKKVFAEYSALKKEERPKNDDEKRDQWMVRFSRVVGHNLGPFFTTWGVPVSQKAKDSIADLPVWMPANFPPESPRKLRQSPQATVVSVSSTYGKNAAERMVDGFDDSFWYSSRSADNGHPHEVIIDLGESMTIRGVTYQPRKYNANGRIQNAEIAVSSDAKKWFATQQATFPEGDELQRVILKEPVQCRYLRFIALKGFKEQTWATIAELDVIR